MLAAAALLCACGTAYRPAKGGTGYSEAQVSSNEFSIHFQANANTPFERVCDYALLRSAEVTLQHGFSHFAVLDVTNTSSAKSYFVAPTTYVVDSSPPVYPSYSGGRAMVVAGTVHPLYLPTAPEERIYYEPGTRLHIKCFEARPDKPFTFDAAAVAQSLKRQYGLK